MATHRFGGAWTERKLDALRRYLVQYQKIFTTNQSAKKLKTIYVDAFAGTGDRDTGEDLRQASLFGYDDDSKWADRLTKLFGTDEWKSQFYREGGDMDLFGARRESATKIAGVDEILEFILKRLNSVFERTVERPLILLNSKKSPMYALCFAAGNPKGAPTAVKIASHLVRG